MKKINWSEIVALVVFVGGMSVYSMLVMRSLSNPPHGYMRYYAHCVKAGHGCKAI